MLLTKFREALERDWAPMNKGRLIPQADYERAWDAVQGGNLAARIEKRDRQIAQLMGEVAKLTKKVATLKQALDESTYRAGKLERELDIKNTRISRLEKRDGI